MSRTYNFHITNNTNETIYYGCYYSSSTTYCGYPDCIPSSYYVALAAGQSATKTVTLSSSYCGTFAIKSTTASFLLNSKRYQYNSTNVSDKIWYLAGKFIYASLLGSSQSTTDDYYYTVDSIIPFNQVPVTIGSKRALSALTTTNTQMSEEPLRYYLDSNGEIQFTYTIRKPLKFSSSSYSSNLYALSSSQSSSNYVSKLSYKKLFGSNPYYSYISCYICKQDSAPTSEELSSLLS